MHKCLDDCVLKNSKNEYLTWLVGLLGPVLMGSKPAELISFPNFDNSKDNKINLIKEHFKICKRIKFKVISLKNNSTKVFFYNPDSLCMYLNEHKNKRFLQSKGYPLNYELNDYIDAMITTIENGVIPDEIGVFLGYPLKDIMGFIGHPSLNLTKVNGWRVYGNPRISDMRYKEFTDDRNHISNLLESKDFTEVLYMM